MQIKELKKCFRHIQPDVFGFAELIKYAVLIPLVEVEDKLSLLFEVRSFKLRRQPGEICFPGGKIEIEDIDEKATAIRETSEELGIIQSDIDVIGNLGVLVPPVQIAIYTYIGQIKRLDSLRINKDEVAEIFTVPLDYLLQSEPEEHELHLGFTPAEAFPFELIPGGRDYKFRERRIPEYFYFYEDRIIWGLTARILKEFLDKLKREKNQW